MVLKVFPSQMNRRIPEEFPKSHHLVVLYLDAFVSEKRLHHFRPVEVVLTR